MPTTYKSNIPIMCISQNIRVVDDKISLFDKLMLRLEEQHVFLSLDLLLAYVIGHLNLIITHNHNQHLQPKYRIYWF